MKRRRLLYPLWLRYWHWTNAVLFVSLVVTGISLHLGSQAIPFATARQVHNVSGLMLAANWVVLVLGNARLGNWRHYRPELKGLIQRMIRQVDFYRKGIFHGEPHPFPPTTKQKFNPLQQITYLGVVYMALPALILNGIVYMFPELAIDIFDYGAIWLVALLHYMIALFLFVFMLGHIYLATAGETVTADIRMMIGGWADVEEDGDERT
ncbi:MAG: cytochrome b/b6 domain-containing protein [Alphaproteobacteria bacterium]